MKYHLTNTTSQVHGRPKYVFRAPEQFGKTVQEEIHEVLRTNNISIRDTKIGLFFSESNLLANCAISVEYDGEEIFCETQAKDYFLAAEKALILLKGLLEIRREDCKYRDQKGIPISEEELDSMELWELELRKVHLTRKLQA